MGSRTQPRYPRRSGRGLLSAVTRRIFNPPLAFPSKFSETCECISQSRISRASVGSHRSQSCLYPDRSMSAFRSIFNVAGQTWLLTSATEIRLHSPPASGCSLTRVKRLSVVRHTQKISTSTVEEVAVAGDGDRLASFTLICRTQRFNLTRTPSVLFTGRTSAAAERAAGQF